jgi:SSS family solute:Na+ symporter
VIFADAVVSAAVLAWALLANEGLDVYRAALPTFVHELTSVAPLHTMTTALAVTVLVILGADYHQFVVAARRPAGAVLGCLLAAAALLVVAFLPPAVVVAAQQVGALDGLADPKQVMPLLPMARSYPFRAWRAMI